MGERGYDNYEDWYDNGPGSEAFARDMRESERRYHEERAKEQRMRLKKKTLIEERLEHIEEVRETLIEQRERERKREEAKSYVVDNIIAPTINWYNIDNPPQEPEEGDAYFNSKDGYTYIYVNGSLCQFTGGSSSGSSGVRVSIKKKEETLIDPLDDELFEI